MQLGNTYNTIKKEFDSNPVYNKKFLRTKIKSNYGKINTHFQNNKLPKEDTRFICLSVISIDSIFRTGKNYYPQVFLDELKNVIKEEKIHYYITGDAEISSDSDEENSDESNSDEEILEKIQTKKILVKKILAKKTLLKKVKFFLHT